MFVSGNKWSHTRVLLGNSPISRLSFVSRRAYKRQTITITSSSAVTPFNLSQQVFHSQRIKPYSTSQSEEKPVPKQEEEDEDDAVMRPPEPPRPDVRPSIAVILSGPGGFVDGNDTIETICWRIQIDRAGFKPVFYADPSQEVEKVYNYIKKQDMPREERLIFRESARIVREVEPIDTLNMSEHVALVFPSGAGNIRNMCNIEELVEGGDSLDWAELIPDVEKSIKDAHRLGKPIVSMGQATVLCAIALRDAISSEGPQMTAPRECLEWISELGSRATESNNMVDDEQFKLVSCGGASNRMGSKTPFDLFEEIESVLRRTLKSYVSQEDIDKTLTQRGISK